MGYSYSPNPADERARLFFSKRGKHLAIAAVVLFLAAIFYFANVQLTSFATYSRGLEQQLNDAKTNLSIIQVQKESCQASLDSTSNNLNTCKNDLNYANALTDNCNKDKNSLNSNINILSASLGTCNTERDSAIQSFKQIIRNSVKAMCCSYGDVQSGSVRSWNIVNNSVACTGNYTVNCSSGETNY